MGKAEFKILIASDIHLGYAEKDPIRGEDSFNSFEEVLQIGLNEKVDFVILGGDLFHENRPSPKSLSKCVELLRKYVMGDREVHFDIVSDMNESLSHSKHFNHINFADENLNIQLPIFSIHGNHDDPFGKEAISVMDLLSTTGLVNYFGKQSNINHIEVSPILLVKENVKIAIYGIGSLPEERFHKHILSNKVSFLELEDKNDWFNIFVVHQNRVKHGNKYLPEYCLTDLPDFVIWGHEHESKTKTEYNPQQKFNVYQPGSTVATSLCPGEAASKHVGLLKVYIDENNQYQAKLTPIPLKTVRQLYIEDVFLDKHFIKLNMPSPTVVDVEDFLTEKIEKIIKQAKKEHSGDKKQPELPLIRLRVNYSNEYLTLSSNHFGQRFVNQVANPKDLILFKCKKNTVKTDLDIDSELIDEICEDEEKIKHCNIDSVMNEYFENVDDGSKLSLLCENKITSAVKEIVEKDTNSSNLELLIDWHSEKIYEEFKKKIQLDQVLKDKYLVEEIFSDFKEKIKKEQVDEIKKFRNFKELKEQYEEKKKESISSSDEEIREFKIIPETDSEEEKVEKPKRGRGQTRGRGRGRGKVNNTKSKTLSDYFTVPKK